MSPQDERVPIQANWKVSEVLQRYPDLLEVLVNLNPAFRHLRNPLLRRVQTRLVTVAQAAQVAGLETSSLLRSLNEAIGLSATEEDSVTSASQDGAPAGQGNVDFSHVEVAVDLDVRPYQERGEEPFSAIMAAAAKVPQGQALRLRNTFEPVPLYRVLDKQGFTASARQLGPNDWEILFLRMGQTSRPDSSTDQPARPRPAVQAQDAEQPGAWERPDAVVTIDVSELVPPEPMVRILEAAQQLSPGQTLLVHHARRPVYLYPRLDELGFLHETREIGPEQVEILIRKPAAS